MVGVDNLVSGQRSNVDDLRRDSKFAFIEQNLSIGVPETGPITAIYNFACPASPVDFATRPLEILAVCSRGVEHLVNLARQHGASLLHASTSEVYGDPLVHPQPESYWGNVNPIGARACYDEGKRFAEALLTTAARRYHLTVRIARIFNTYGPRMRKDDGRALPNFITQALQGQALTVHGDGKQTRSFCYIDDLVDGLLKLAASNVSEPLNLGNPDEVSILEVAQEVIDLLGSTSEIEFLPSMPDDPKVRKPDIEKARRLLAWEPRVRRLEGLRETVRWFRRQHGR